MAQERKGYKFAVDKGKLTYRDLCSLFSEFFVMLRQNGEEKAIESLASQCKLMPPPDKSGTIFKYEGRFYELKGQTPFSDRWTDSYFCMLDAEELDLAELKRESIKCLRDVVEGPLSSGDKLIINKLAVKTLEDFLERSADKNDPLNFSAYDCSRTDFNRVALYELGTYGFKINASYIKDIDMRSRGD